jgi:cardiolipin synthase A/B
VLKHLMLVATFVLLGWSTVVAQHTSSYAASSLPRGVVPAETIIEPDDGVTPVIHDLDASKKSIFMEAYILSDTSVIHALERAAAQDVTVDVLLERHPLGLGTYEVHIKDELQAAGVAVRWSSPHFTFTHAKFVVMDDRAALVSTANFSRSAFDENREVIVRDTSPPDVRDLSNIFRSDWDGKNPTLHSANVVVSPINSRKDIDLLLNSAHHTVDIYGEEMADTRSDTLLASLGRRHIAVRILLPPGAASGTHTLPSSLTSVVAVRTISSPYMHAKVVVIDDKEAFIGSENFSATSFDHNREVGLFVRGSMKRIEADFAADWKRGVAP